MKPAKAILRRTWGFAAGGGGVVVLDALTKAMVVSAFSREALVDAGARAFPAGGFLGIEPTHNTGTLFRILLPYLDPALAYGILFATAAVLLFRHASARPSGAVRWGTALVVGGGAGNLLDRIATGRVVDFLSLGWPGSGWRTPNFNVADMAICSGAALLVWGEIRFARTPPARRGTPATASHGDRNE